MDSRKREIDWPKLFNFFNLLDSEGRLSITNLAVYITLLKLVYSPSASITEAGMLLLTLANYAHKRKAINDNQKPPVDTFTPQIGALKAQLEAYKEDADNMRSKVSAISLSNGLKQMNIGNNER